MGIEKLSSGTATGGLQVIGVDQIVQEHVGGLGVVLKTIIREISERCATTAPAALKRSVAASACFLSDPSVGDIEMSRKSSSVWDLPQELRGPLAEKGRRPRLERCAQTSAFDPGGWLHGEQLRTLQRLRLAQRGQVVIAYLQKRAMGRQSPE